MPRRLHRNTYSDVSGMVTPIGRNLHRSLSSMRKRLDLLGYTLSNVESMYNELIRETHIHSIEVSLSFDSFYSLLREIDISKINTPNFEYEFDQYDYDLGEFVRRCIIPEQEIYSKLIKSLNGNERELYYDLECFFENMVPYIILRLLAENPNSAELDVYWAYADLVDSGWISKEDICSPLSESKKILIVTEGSTDSKILQKAIDELYPEISDFFSFIDMEENYPFTGTGNLYNFCCGLSKIGILNNVIAIFDNDCAGTEKYEKLKTIPKQSNLLIVKLPDSSAFNSVHTLGPQGNSYEDINGTAVAIECFLDFDSVDFQPSVRWTSYFEKMKKYQGVLQSKDKYTRAFFKADIKSDNYDTSKLKYLIDYIIDQWCSRIQHQNC